MSKYGYNPDEHFQTKVTLIDKDGFHKESDEAPGGGSSEGLEEGIYAHAYKANNDGYIYMNVIIDCTNRTDTFLDNGYDYATTPYMTYLYFGEKLDENKFENGNDSINYDHTNLGDYFENNNILFYQDIINISVRINKNYVTISGEFYSPQYEEIMENVQNDVQAHFIAYYVNPYVDDASGYQNFVFIDGTIKLEEWS